MKFIAWIIRKYYVFKIAYYNARTAQIRDKNAKLRAENQELEKRLKGEV